MAGPEYPRASPPVPLTTLAMGTLKSFGVKDLIRGLAATHTRLANKTAGICRLAGRELAYFRIARGRGIFRRSS
jgi:hypothetical protein